MAINTEVQYETESEFDLDPKNPRLGRENTSKELSQEQVLEIMQGWTLDELAVSFLESGFWPQEPLLVVLEERGGVSHKVVVEGNRRLAALRLLFRAKRGNPLSRKWETIAKSARDEQLDRLKQIPYIVVDSREDVEAYLGFRHVTGIKEWEPAEKAEFIKRLIDARHMSYEEVARRIGSNAPTVRRHYIAFQLLLQMEHFGGRRQTRLALARRKHVVLTTPSSVRRVRR